MLKVIIFCNSRILGDGIESLLNQSELYQVLGVATSESEFKGLLSLHHDICITDPFCCDTVLNLSTKNGRAKVLMIDPGIEIIPVYETLKKQIDAGLKGIFPVTAGKDLLFKSLSKLQDGEMWFERRFTEKAISKKNHSLTKIPLTKKEGQILDCICNGFSNKEIADSLFISEQTVKTHCNSLYKKFGVENRLKLALIVTKHRYMNFHSKQL